MVFVSPYVTDETFTYSPIATLFSRENCKGICWSSKHRTVTDITKHQAKRARFFLTSTGQTLVCPSVCTSRRYGFSRSAVVVKISDKVPCMIAKLFKSKDLFITLELENSSRYCLNGSFLFTIKKSKTVIPTNIRGIL